MVLKVNKYINFNSDSENTLKNMFLKAGALKTHNKLYHPLNENGFLFRQDK